VGRAKGATHKRKPNQVNAPKACGLARPVKEVVAYGGRAGRHDGLGWIPGENQIGN
jgi:hypothetical protein